MSLIEGTIFDEVWVIERSLGSGGMGSVYRAHNRHAPKIKAAIKVLSAALVHHKEAKSRFVREAEILYGLDHPHIVKDRNIRLEHDPPYIEMEFIERQSLYEVLAQPPFPFDRALLFSEQLASAVRYVHRHNVFHRDIKPANLLIRKGAMLKLVDFGLAVDVEGSERITQDGAHFGTVAYAPPEWIRPRDVDPRLWDLYALGVIMYEMFAGRTPFVADEGASPRQAAVQIMALKQQIEYLDPGPAYPEGLRALIRDLTVREASQRLGDAKQVLKRLQRVQQEMSFNANTVLASGGLEGDELRVAVHQRALEISRDSSEHAAPPRPIKASKQGQIPASVRPRRAHVPRSGLQFITAAFVGLGMIFFFATLTVLAITVWRSWTAPQPRPVAVLLTGIPRDAEVAVALDGAPPAARDGLTASFGELEPGTYQITWSSGRGCADDPCPGEGCPDTCQLGSTELVVTEGEGELSVPVELTLPTPREVQLRLAAGAPADAEVVLEGVSSSAVDGVVTLPAVPPGSYQVEARSGTCADDQVGCAAEGTCPKGCSSLVVPIHVPASGPVRVPPIQLPAPARAAVQPRPTTPSPRPSKGSGQPVSRSAYAAWVASHADWAPDAAIPAGRADSSYLKGVDLAAGGSAPVVSIPWAAAKAYCAGRGGLADVGSEPTSWKESSTGLFQEWRVQQGGPAWLRYDGASSSQLSQTEANAFTGFRCAR